MRWHMPACIRDLPTPVKVAGGAALGYLAYQAAVADTPEEWVAFHRVAATGIAGVGAALLLGSAAGDVIDGRMAYKNPFVDAGTGDRVDVETLNGAARYLHEVRHHLAADGDFQGALAVERARCSLVTGDVATPRRIDEASRLLRAKGATAIADDLDALRPAVASQMKA